MLIQLSLSVGFFSIFFQVQNFNSTYIFLIFFNYRKISIGYLLAFVTLVFTLLSNFIHSIMLGNNSRTHIIHLKNFSFALIWAQTSLNTFSRNFLSSRSSRFSIQTFPLETNLFHLFLTNCI